MTRFSRPAVAAVLTVVVAVFALACPAGAAAAPPTLYVYPTETPPGLPVQLTGRGYPASARVVVRFDGRWVGEATTDATGRLATKVGVPGGAQPGTHNLAAVPATGRAGRSTVLVRSGWPQEAFSGWRNNKNPYENTLSAGNVSQVRRLFDAPWAYQTSVVGGGRVYSNISHDLQASDARTGARLWVNSGYPGPLGGITYAYGEVWFTEDGFISGADPATGQFDGKYADFKAGDSDAGPPLAAAGLLFTAGNSNTHPSGLRVSAWDPATLKRVWVNDDFRTGDISRGLTYGEGTLFVRGTGTTEFERVVALDAFTGRLKPGFSGPFAGGAPVFFDPDYAHPRLYMPERGSVVALDANTGAELWRSPPETYAHDLLTVTNGLVIVPGGSSPDRTADSLYAFDLETGQQRWVRRNPSGAVTYAIAANGLLFHSEQGIGVVALEATTGRLVATLDPTCNGGGTHAVADGVIYQSCYPGERAYALP